MKQETIIKKSKEVKRKKRKEIMTKASTNYINNKLHIENKYASLISLIDTIYPPLLCTLCDTISTTRIQSNLHFKENHKKKSRYLCIHPHCDKSFISKGALRFHISRSHLVHYSKKPLPDPIFIHTTKEEGSLPTITKSPLITPIIISKPMVQKPTQPKVETVALPITKIAPKKEKLFTSILIEEEDLTPSPPPSPFSLYHNSRKNLQKKPTLSTTAESFLNSMYPPLQCPSCHQIFNRKTNVIKHLTETHLGQEPYRCIYPKCAHPRLYATREGLIYHIIRVHDNDNNNNIIKK